MQRISDPVARKQVMAATGQVRLMETYRQLFQQHGLTVAQVLTSKSDFQTRRHYLNMRGCIDALLTAGIVPIVNENDVVAITELMFTDNDELAGLLAGMVNADLLCLLSTVPRRVRRRPGRSGHPLHRDLGRRQSPDRRDRAARHLGPGARRHAQQDLRSPARRPNWAPKWSSPTAATRKSCQRSPAKPCGHPFPGAGRSIAGQALAGQRRRSRSRFCHRQRGRRSALLDSSRLTSLLPVGIEAVEGHFNRGDVIQIRNPAGRFWAAAGPAMITKKQPG